jgi:phage-related protein
MPDSRPMPQIGPRCHELRIRDSANNVIWRIIYRLDPDVVVIAEVFCKKNAKHTTVCNKEQSKTIETLR